MPSPYDPQYAGIRAKIVKYARAYGIDPQIAIKQIWQESRFNSRAGSGAGAKGIAQFMPATAQRFNVDVYDVDSSLNGWGKYMSWLLNRYNGDYKKALAGYNAGEGAVDKYVKRGYEIPPFKETRNYVAIILGDTANAVRNSVENYTAQTVSLFGFGDNYRNVPLQTVSKETKQSVILVVAFIVVVGGLVYAFK
jgi:soluble lytic murein transglycosylase-like protein